MVQKLNPNYLFPGPAWLRLNLSHMVILTGYVMCRCGQLMLVANNSCWGYVCNNVLPHLTLLLYLPRVFMVCVGGLSGLTGFPSPFFIPLGRPRPLGAASGMLILLLLIWYELWFVSSNWSIYNGKRGMMGASPYRRKCPIT